MKITVTGLYGAGSSAVFDLLEEFSCNSSGLKDERAYEHTALYFPGGLFDLEDKLLLCNDLHRSDEAIATFLREMKRLDKNNFGWFGSFRDLFGNDFWKIVQELIDDLQVYDIRSNYYGQYQGVRFSIVKVFLQLGAALLQKRKIYKWGRLYRKKPWVPRMRTAFPSEKEFYQASTKFVNAYMSLFDDGKHKNVIFDRLLLCQHLYRMPRYFGQDFRVIAVKRDIRDAYILNKYIWPGMHLTGMYPKDLHEFVRYWKHMTANIRQIQDDRILSIWFEDLIYNYEETAGRIMSLCGLTSREHTDKGRYFQPERSIYNTQVYRGHPQWQREIKYLEKELPEYIYPFPYQVHSRLDRMFDDSRI